MGAFHFFTKHDQVLLLGLRARTIQELLTDIRSVPDSSIYFHTHRFLPAPAFSQKLPVPQVLIAPSIDPVSDKNKELDEKTHNGSSSWPARLISQEGLASTAKNKFATIFLDYPAYERLFAILSFAL
jgi:Family of unknown function (DUF5752)